MEHLDMILHRIIDLAADPGYVLLPMDRYEELIRAEAERDILDQYAEARKRGSDPDAATCVRWASGRCVTVQDRPTGEKTDAE